MSIAEEAELTKALLFNTSIRLFKEQGYADAIVSSICQATGVAKGTFCVLYESKESIIKQSYYLNSTRFM
ncbi:TetR/AcrR family transcriptional regulator [Listeria monocytogenes]|uniref:TetR/AcrR family transcriptional regulator n=1 Tax=Listeria monocytogenes TaxID=1639 RepID=UPI00190F7443|nr:TetR/AcrR family transcriptional regulator [Listeria monocytogenes]